MSYMLAVLLLLLACIANARNFHSRDVYVREVIAFCQGNDSSAAPARVPGESECQPMLKCILNTVDQAAQGRWSAGAAILAFIPSIAALISNSIDDVVLVSEESKLLALALSLCSLTVFPSRFGGERHRFKATAAIQEELKYHILRGCEKQDFGGQLSRWSYHAVFGGILALLLACCVLIWYPTIMISRNGVVIFSCDPQIHMPIWIALAQLLPLCNVLFKSVSTRAEKISLCRTTCSTVPQTWPQTVILRHPSKNVLAQAIRAITSVLSLALYAYATAVLGGMTMIPASDAVRALVMIAANAGVGRIICSYTISQDHSWKTTVVIDVAPWQIKDLKSYVETEVQNATFAGVGRDT